MKRKIRFSEKMLLAGLSLILIFMFVQDWIPLSPLNDVQAIAKAHSFNELLIVTMVGVVQLILLIGGVIFFMGKRYPILVKLWLIIHQICIFVGVLIDWWIPYFFGIGAGQRAERYNQMFGDTHSFLPVMNGIVPNTLHTFFHTVLFLCIILTIYISFTDSREKEKMINVIYEHKFHNP